MASEAGQEQAAPLFAVSAEFADSRALLAAVLALRDRGLGRLDCYTPIPVPAVDEALRLHAASGRPAAPIGFAAGFAAMMGMCIYATAYSYVFIVGGRPRVSWQSFVVPSVAAGVMTGALAAMFGFFVLNRLPRLNHPAFNIPGFSRATRDRFFLAVEARDERFDPGLVERALGGLAQRPLATHRVPR